MSQQERDLQSCPFCDARDYGDEGVRLRLISTSNGYYAVTCYCGAAGPIRDSEEKAIEAWNRRDFSRGDEGQHLFSSSFTLGQVGLRGDLQSFDFSMVLQVVSKGEKTGVLYFRQGEEVRALHLRGGNIIAAGGNEGLRLGQIGCGKGLISQEQLQEVLIEAKKTGRRMGEVLLDLSYINEDELKELIRHQIREIVLEISCWKEGDFEFRDYPEEFDERGIEDINIMRIILEAAVRRDERAAA
jgi:Lar family restriction alleviation protein